MAKKTVTRINLCVYGVPPAPVYKGVEEGRAGPPYGAPKGSPTPSRSRFPPCRCQNRRISGRVSLTVYLRLMVTGDRAT